jgi:hypothetical protein
LQVNGARSTTQQIAAFLDGSLSRAEWDAVATRLANDPVARAELAAAVALLDEIQAQPATAPAGLMERAAGVLAASEQNQPAGFGGGGHSSCLVPAFDGVVRLRSRRPGSDRGTDCFEDGWRRRNDRGQAGDAGDTISRTIVVTPSSPTKKKDAQSCIDANEQARNRHPITWEDRARTRRPEGAERPGEAPTENNDPCGPKAGSGR